MMLLRRVIAVLNLVLFGLAVLAEFLFPRYSTYIFYGLLIWMFATLFIFFGPNRDRVLGAPRPTGYAQASGAAPLPSGPVGTIGFCVYCGTNFTAGTTVCPACGRPAQSI